MVHILYTIVRGHDVISGEFEFEICKRVFYCLLCNLAMASKENELAPPSAKKKRLSLSLSKKHKEPNERFPLLPIEQIESTKKLVIPKNTQKSTKWALRAFSHWLKQRNERSDDKCPEDILSTDNNEELCHWLCVCVNEIRKEDGEPYTPRSVSQLVAGLQRHISEQKDVPVRLADPANPAFRPLHRTLDNIYRQLHAEGVGTKRKQAEVLSVEEEEQLWSTGAVGTASPSSLLGAVFFYNGLNFVLRGGMEHRELRISQLSFRSVPDPDIPGQLIDCVEYTEHGSKNRPGGHHQLNLENKSVLQYARPELGERCHVYLLRLYLSKLPESAFQRDIFYMKPRGSIPHSPADPWYTNVPLGHNSLGTFLKRILSEAGVDTTNKSNHSLRATAISRMYQRNVPEKLIMERSGHLSRDGVMSYERTTAAQQKALCATLSGSSSSNSINPNVALAAMKQEGPPESTSSTYQPNPVKQEGGPEHACVKREELDARAPGDTKQADDLLKKLQFNHMTGCTFNISLNI